MADLLLDDDDEWLATIDFACVSLHACAPELYHRTAYLTPGFLLLCASLPLLCAAASVVDRIVESVRSQRPPNGDVDGDSGPHGSGPGAGAPPAHDAAGARHPGPPNGAALPPAHGQTGAQHGTEGYHPLVPPHASQGGGGGALGLQGVTYQAPPRVQSQPQGHGGTSPQLLAAENARLRTELATAEARVHQASARVAYLEQVQQQQQQQQQRAAGRPHSGGGSGQGHGSSGGGSAAAMVDLAELRAEVGRVRSELAFRDEEARKAQRDLDDARERLAAAAAAVATAEGHAAAAAKERDDALAAAAAVAKEATARGTGGGGSGSKRGRDGAAGDGPAAAAIPSTALDVHAVAFLRLSAPLPPTCALGIVAASTGTQWGVAGAVGGARVGMALTPEVSGVDTHRLLDACRVVCSAAHGASEASSLGDDTGAALDLLAGVLCAPEGGVGALWRDALVTSLSQQTTQAQPGTTHPLIAAPSRPLGRIFVADGTADWCHVEHLPPGSSSALSPLSDGAPLACSAATVGKAFAAAGGICNALCRVALLALHSRLASTAQPQQHRAAAAQRASHALATRVAVSSMRCIAALVTLAPALDACRAACVAPLLVTPSLDAAGGDAATSGDAVSHVTTCAPSVHSAAAASSCLLARCFSRDAPPGVVLHAANCFAALAACPAGRDAMAAQLQAPPPPSGDGGAAQPPRVQPDGALPRALRCLEADGVPLAARRACLRGVTSLAHCGWLAWPNAARQTRTASRLVSAASAALAPGAAGCQDADDMAFGGECLRLLYWLLIDKDTAAVALRELAGDVPSAQRALSCGAAACDAGMSGGQGGEGTGADVAANLRKLGRALAEKVSAHVAAAEREAAAAHAQHAARLAKQGNDAVVGAGAAPMDVG